jgi:FAD-linked sulfhydryl oxidase
MSLRDDIIPDANSTPLRLNRASLGHISWKVLHSFAAAYPQEPKEEHKQALLSLIQAFRVLYPCEVCRGHFNRMIDENPVVTSNRHDVVIYFCEIHNIVNKRLGKPLFDCDKALEYWGGDCGCHGDSSSSGSSEQSAESSSSAIEQSEEGEVAPIPAETD